MSLSLGLVIPGAYRECSELLGGLPSDAPTIPIPEAFEDLEEVIRASRAILANAECRTLFAIQLEARQRPATHCEVHARRLAETMSQEQS